MKIMETTDWCTWNGGCEAVVCPYCAEKNNGNDYFLHHGKIEIFSRGEDDDIGMYISHDSSGHLTVDSKSTLDGNPSPRRHGLSITFSCENCENHPILDIIQHKGNTFVGWRDGH